MQIPLTDIDLNLKNPRFKTKKDSQRDALTTLADSETIALARNIAVNGLNPTKRLAVFKIGDQYTTAEGNRRLTALKLLANQALLDSLKLSKATKAELKRAPKAIIPSLKVIDCAVFESEADAAPWVRLEHTGKNGGVGTVDWNREQNRRFDSQFSSDKPKELQAIDYLRNAFATDKLISHKLESIPMATLERLIGDPDALAFFGLEWEKKKLISTLHEDEIHRAMRKVVEDLTNPDSKKRVTTRTLDRKADRLAYLQQFNSRSKPNYNNTVEPWAIDGPIPVASSHTDTTKTGGTKKPTPSTETRKKLLTPGCILKIEGNVRINDIYHNLKSDLGVEKYSNAVSVLARLFIEMTVNHYLLALMGKNEFEIHDSRYKLATKLGEVVKHLNVAKKLNKNQVQAINKELGNTSGAFHPNSLNAFVHNPNLSPSATDLKRGWNNIEPLITAIWS